MIGCNSTDDELEERERAYVRELEQRNRRLEERIRELEAEATRRRDEVIGPDGVR